MLKYIVHQLYASQTSEIIVLEKLILKMAGIEPLPSLSDVKVQLQEEHAKVEEERKLHGGEQFDDISGVWCTR